MADYSEYKDNSYKSRSSLNMAPAEKKEENKPHAKKVITGGVKTKKKGLMSKFKETFITEDLDVVKERVAMDLIAGVKGFILDAFEMVLFGESSRNLRKKGTSTINYSSISTRGRSSVDDAKKRISVRDSRADIDDLYFDSRGDADMVLDQMLELISQYGQCTIADLYESVGKGRDIVYTDYKYGWTDISSAQIVKVRGEGYLIKLPRPGIVD